MIRVNDLANRKKLSVVSHILSFIEPDKSLVSNGKWAELFSLSLTWASLPYCLSYSGYCINFCNTLSSTNILYYHHDSCLQDDDRIYVFEKPSSAQQENQLIIPQEVWIRINNTTPNDTANYTCIAENAAGRNETQMHIIIQREFVAAKVQKFRKS